MQNVTIDRSVRKPHGSPHFPLLVFCGYFAIHAAHVNCGRSMPRLAADFRLLCRHGQVVRQQVDVIDDDVIGRCPSLHSGGRHVDCFDDVDVVGER